MALVDLSSDLSKFRSEVSKETRNTPEASKATHNKNFATVQPITARLSQFSKPMERQEPKQLESKLSSTKLDDIIKIAQQSLLINSVSKYSKINENYTETTDFSPSTEIISSKYGNIRTDEFSSKLTKSNIVTIKQEQGIYNISSPIGIEKSIIGQNNLLSPTDIVVDRNDTSDDVVNPKIDIIKPPQTFERQKTSPNVTPLPNEQINNIVDPKIEIVSKPLSFDRKNQSVKISKDLVSPINNITDPKTLLDINTLTYERADQSPFILTETKQDGFVQNPNIRVFKFDGTTIQTEDNSRLNLDELPSRFIPISRLENFELPREIDGVKYNGESIQTEDNSSLNVDTVIKTNPAGRNENPNKSKFSIIGNQEVNFFPDTNARGFVIRQQKGQTFYKNTSEFSWNGKKESAPTTNFLTDINGKGFNKFAQQGVTDYETDSSIFGFTTINGTDFLDVTKTYTTSGFKTFSTIYQSDYKEDASIFTFSGASQNAPVVNYFDVTKNVTTDGFSKFSQLYDTKYIPDSSVFTWAGNRNDPPETNFFDLDGNKTSVGFHKFASLYDSKYIPDSSQFDWDGNRQNSPEVNYFDLSGKNTEKGFQKFAQLYESRYISDSSNYNWDGNREQAPETNYFDLNNTNGVGFTKFIQTYDTKYIHQSSRFDWDGNRQDAPEVNYFDIDGSKTSTGFHKFAQIYDTKYVRESSIYDWDGTKQNAPEVNYFDLTNSTTTKGFEKWSQSLVTRYVRDASRFTFKGSNQSAPEVDYLDKNKKYAIKGFERFVQRMVTKYVKDSSEFTFKGASRSAPKTNFFPDTQGKGFTTFPEKLNSEYSKDVSEYTFKGGLPKEVNFFSDSNASGFVNKTPLLETKFEHESSEFAFKGSTPEPIDFLSNTNASGFDIKIGLNETKFVDDSSKFTFKGDGKSAKTTNFFGDTSAKGFTSFPQSLVSEYVGQSSFGISGGGKQVDEIESKGQSKTSGPVSRLTDKDSSFDWKGSRRDAPEVDYFKIQGTNPNGIEGFTKLFDNTETKLTDEFSRFSFASVKNLSPIKKAPYTTFFGYTPSERTGFMTGMSSGDSTLYPIIDPVLKYDEIPNKRFEIEGIRGTRKRLQTANREKYAPLSLGKRPWVDGTLSATLENQVPNLITGGVAGSYENKYERGVKDNTEQKGYLTKWAITRRSPSELDKQYSKFNLRKDAFNFDLIWSQPFVLRGIQGGLEPERWGGILKGVDEGVARGGIVTQLERILFDEQRIGKFLTSIKGIAWNLRQVGLQLMNPVVDVDPKTSESSISGYSSTLVFNPLSVVANVATGRIGFHIARHGAVSFDSSYLNKYETATVNRELTDDNKKTFSDLDNPTLQDKTKYNRLIGLMKELLPNSFKPFNGLQNPSENQSQEKKSEIVRISSTSRGPQSKLGIGETLFHRPSHPYLTYYTTTPNLISGQNEPSYLDSARRDSFYSVNADYASHMKESGMFGILKAFAYVLENGPKEQNESTTTSDSSQNIQKSVIDSITKLNPFVPKYDTVQSRLERITKDSVSKTETLLANSNHPDNKDKDGLLKQYRTANYDKLKRNDRRQSRFFNDFRADLDIDFGVGSSQENPGRAFVTNPNIARFDSRNLSERYGFGDQGRAGVSRDTPFLSTIKYEKFQDKSIIEQSGPSEFHSYAVPKEKDGQYFRGDRINIIDYKRANFKVNTSVAYELGNTTTGIPGTRDLIEFYFSSLVLQGHDNCPAEVIVFRATFGNITDNHKPSWNSVKYMGRADPLYVYQGYEREISFDFTVHIGSRDEMRASWRKLNYLASWTAPEYRPSGLMRGPMIRLNIGHLYRKMPGYISSLSYTFDNTQTNWETAKLPEDMNLNAETKDQSAPGVLQLPKHIDVNVSFVPVGVYRPEFRGVMYSLYDDSAANNEIETGLIPDGAKNRVNYFIEHYNLNGEPVIYSGYENGKPYGGQYKIDPANDPDVESGKKRTPVTTTNQNEKPSGDTTPSTESNTEVTNPVGTTQDNTPPPLPPPPNTANPITNNSSPVVTSTSTISPSPTAIEEKIFQLAVVGTNPVPLYDYVGDRGIWFQVGAKNANRNGYTPFGPGKDAAIAYIRAFIGVKQDGTTNASD